MQPGCGDPCWRVPKGVAQQLRNKPTRPVPVETTIEWRKVPELPEPDFIERWLPIAILVLGVGWTAFLLAVLAHRLGWA